MDEVAEPLALQGAQRLLREANPPVWLLEMNGALHRYGFTEQGLSDWLAARGYEMVLYNADRNALDFGAAPWLQRPNVLAIANSARSLVERRLRDAP